MKVTFQISNQINGKYVLLEHDHANGSDIGSEGDYAEEGEYEDETDEEVFGHQINH